MSNKIDIEKELKYNPAYTQLVQHKMDFIKSAKLSYDEPGHVYFKIYFHFDTGSSYSDSADNIYHGGLLTLPPAGFPTFKINENIEYDSSKKNYPEISKSDIYIPFLRGGNSAWGYLYLNCEDERALLLQTFIKKLYTLSVDRPWYFQKIQGLDTALERKQVSDNSMKIDEIRQKISINCLQDSRDEQIGTLLDLYRSIVFSWQQKKEILPANLRKFDMSILIIEADEFERQINNMVANDVRNIKDDVEYENSFNRYKNSYLNGNYINPWAINKILSKSSYKYVELHNCEIDYNSSKNGYLDLNNADGSEQTYNIDIWFDNIYEDRYNQWDYVRMGDMLSIDNNDEPLSDGISDIYDNVHYENQSIINNVIVKQTEQDKSQSELKNISSINESIWKPEQDEGSSKKLKFGKRFVNFLKDKSLELASNITGIDLNQKIDGIASDIAFKLGFTFNKIKPIKGYDSIQNIYGYGPLGFINKDILIGDAIDDVTQWAVNLVKPWGKEQGLDNIFSYSPGRGIVFKPNIRMLYTEAINFLLDEHRLNQEEADNLLDNGPEYDTKTNVKEIDNIYGLLERLKDENKIDAEEEKELKSMIMQNILSETQNGILIDIKNEFNKKFGELVGENIANNNKQNEEIKEKTNKISNIYKNKSAANNI